jgi:PIN domain nuclease of toxin-antitoxin system
MLDVVFDSFALLALLRNEKGADMVQVLLERANRNDARLHMTEINYAEVKYTALRKGGAKRWIEIAAYIEAVPIQFHPIDRVLSDSAADFKAQYRMSLGDACAAALASRMSCEIMTGDPEFKAAEDVLKILWIPRT